MPARSLAGRRLVVIGAGFAGLSAARLLRQSGAEVIVLEARERPGGRVLTDRSAGFALDLGPAWLHGGPGNPLKAVAGDAGIATRVTNYANVRFTDTSSGNRIRVPPDNLLAHVRKINNSMESAWLWIELRAGMLASRGKLSVADVFDAAVRRAERRDGPIDRSVIALQRWVLESNLAAPLEEVDAGVLLQDSATGDEDDFTPSDDRYVVAGMDRLIETMTPGLDIRCGAVVREVEWRPGGVRVIYSAADGGTEPGAELRADAAVVTLPVGVLTAGDVRFSPALPSSFTAPLSRLRMGLLNKICLVFPQVFWDTQFDFFAYYADPSPLYYAWLNLARYNGAPAILGFTSGSAARRVESMSQEQLVDDVMRRIRAGGRTHAPDPVAVFASRWGADRYARGSYSYLGVGGSGRDRTRLAEPVENTLFFAGEATHREDPATVHGAWWSGQRAARQILQAV